METIVEKIEAVIEEFEANVPYSSDGDRHDIANYAVIESLRESLTRAKLALSI